MKAQILDLAIRQMKRGGYESLNFADIAATLDTSRANLHHHFKNKEGLAIAATESYIDEQAALFNAVIESHDGDLRTILKALEDNLIDLVSRSGSGNACVCSQLVHEVDAPETLREMALARFHSEEKVIESQVRKAKRLGNVPGTTDAKQLTFVIMTTMLGIGQMTLIESDNKKLIRNIKGALVSLVP